MQDMGLKLIGSLKEKERKQHSPNAPEKIWRQKCNGGEKDEIQECNLKLYPMHIKLLHMA